MTDQPIWTTTPGKGLDRPEPSGFVRAIRKPSNRHMGDSALNKERRAKRELTTKAVALYQQEAVKAREAMGKPLTRKERRLLAQAGRKRK